MSTKNNKIIFGTGLSKTGTSSLSEAFNILECDINTEMNIKAVNVYSIARKS